MNRNTNSETEEGGRTRTGTGAEGEEARAQPTHAHVRAWFHNGEGDRETERGEERGLFFRPPPPPIDHFLTVMEGGERETD